MGVAWSGLTGTLRKRPLIFVFGALIIASGVLLLLYRANLRFLLDDWAFVIGRSSGGVGDYLDPHNEHISIIPVAIYKLFLAIFGMGAAMPLHVLSVLVFLVSVVILFLYMRPLVGEPAAVIGSSVILFLGVAWEDLLWAFQIGFSISIAAGIGGLLMLRRRDSFGDRMACLLLTVSMISTSLGIPFAIAALVDLLTAEKKVNQRIYVVAVPVLIYAIWWIGWGHTASSSVSFSNALHAPEYVFNAFRAAVEDLTGAFKIGGRKGDVFAVLLALAAIGLSVAAMVTRRRIPRTFLIALALALGFWGLAALNVSPGRDYIASRYQYPSAVFLLMILAGAFDGVRIRPRYLTGLGVIALVAIAANVWALDNGYKNLMKPLSDKGIAGLTALDLAGRTVDPDLPVGMNQFDTARVTAEDYFEAEDRYGSAAWSEREIEDSSMLGRARVDQVLVAALPISGTVVSGKRGRECRKVEAGVPAKQTVPLPSRRFTFESGKDVFLAVGRYAGGAPTGAVFSKAGQKTLVRVPADESDEPWRIGFLGKGAVTVCPVGRAF